MIPSAEHMSRMASEGGVFFSEAAANGRHVICALTTRAMWKGCVVVSALGLPEVAGSSKECLLDDLYAYLDFVKEDVCMPPSAMCSAVRVWGGADFSLPEDHYVADVLFGG